MKTIAIMNQKGGVGKTSTTLSLASVLGENNANRVLVVDGDPSCNLTQFFADSIRYDKITPTLQDYLNGNAEADEIVRNFRFERYPGDRFVVTQESETEPVHIKKYVAICKTLYEGETEARLENVEIGSDEFIWEKPDRFTSISLIAGSHALARHTFQNEGEQDSFKNMLSYLSSNEQRPLFGPTEEVPGETYCLIDCPPEDIFVIDPILKASDLVLVPMEVSTDSINGFAAIIRKLKEVHDEGYPTKLLGTFLTKYDKRTNIAKKEVSDFRAALEGTNYLLDTVVALDSQQEKTRNLCVPLPIYKKSVPLSQSYFSLANEVVRRIKEDTENE